MKLNINSPSHSQLIAKYLAGEMSVEEEQQFQELLNNHNENRMLVDRVREDWHLIEQLPKTKLNTDRAWEIISEQINDSSHTISEKRTVGHRRFAIAASIMLLIGMGVLLTLTYNSKPVTVKSSGNKNVLVHTLPDGTTVYLSNDSWIKYNKKQWRTTRSVEFDGKSFFDVAHNAQIPFIVNTHTAEVRVVGTSFSIETKTQEIVEITVKTGKVNVVPKAKDLHTLMVKANEKIKVTTSSITKESLESNNFSFENVQLKFDDESVHNIVNTINKTYNSNIILELPAKDVPHMSVTFENNSIPYMVSIIKETLQLEVQKNDTVYILYRKQ